ncbi:MAG: nucleotide exchange factor GrpE [Candidatus Dojkabacteria bacterium]
MQKLTERLSEIIKEARKLHDKYLAEYSLTVDYVNIFCLDSNEYGFYTNEALKIGVMLKEVSNGIYVKFNTIMDVENISIKTIKVRKPDPTKSTDGALDFVTSDYEILKGELQDNPTFQLSVNTFKQEEIVVSDENTDAYIAIGSIPILETLKQKDELQPQDASSLVDEEKRKRLQLMSDFQNYQKRVEQEKAVFGAMANMSLIQEILEVFDDINLALSDNELTLEHAKSSMKSAQDKLVTAIDIAGVERIPVNIGDEFDKERMEAISTVPGTPEQQGKVIAVISSAFKYKNKDGVLKPAKVVVGK